MIDLWNIERKFRQKVVLVHSPYLEKVRLGDHSKKVRVVLDCPTKVLPSYRIRGLDDALRIVLGKKPKEQAFVPKPRPAPEKPLVKEDKVPPPPPVTRKIAPPVSKKGPYDKNYVIGPDDALEIQVWDHEDLERKVRVSSEGDFSYPLIGKVHASGLTVLELEKEISRRLGGKYIVNPQVTINVKEYRSKKVFVLGHVGHRGTYSVTGQATLVTILSKAGGPTAEAGTKVTVIRPRNHVRKGNPIPLEQAREGEVIVLDLEKLMGGDISQNIDLQDGDTIYVLKAEYFFVFGQVKKPGKYVLEKGTTVLKAITVAGGLTDIASARRTKIVREKEGLRVKLKARMTDPVMAQDVIMVPESFF